MRDYFGFSEWPKGIATLDLGGRVLEVMPLPGHQSDALAVYDPRTKFILSGDSFYPGRLYIKEWGVFKDSIRRLLEYAKTKPLNGVLGTHIEMKSEPEKDYDIGTTYQPDEASLVLTLADLQALDTALDKLGGSETRKRLDKVIIYPVK